MASAEKLVTFGDYFWVSADDSIITIGLNDEAVGKISDVVSLELPSEGDPFEADDVCGEIQTDDGAINLFSPIAGTIVETNKTVEENPGIVLEDPTGEGWLFRLEADDAAEIDRFLHIASEGGSDEDKEEDEDLDEDSDDESEELETEEEEEDERL